MTSRGVPERFVSYAQNLEDVMLWRALRSLGPGFYIDLGAADPVRDSVTKAFYDRGWHGINVEPMTEPFERLQHERPRDINLQVAVEAEPGRKTYFSVDGGNGLSTGTDRLAEAYRAEGRAVTEVEVATETLASICDAHVTQDIHFLKIDVEGGEDLVLQGADFRRWRPWIILIESPEASPTPRSPTWHALVGGAGYKHVHFDGLNRFYVANEKLSTLESFFVAPPNLFDNFVQHREVELEERLATVIGELDASGNARAQAELAARACAEERTSLQTALETSSADAELRAQLGRIRADLESSVQQQYESAQQLGWMSVQRQQHVARISEQELDTAALENRVAALTETVSRLETSLGYIERSRSWRLMSPVRTLSRNMRRYRSRHARPHQ